jgi:DNA ligase (NAD+)
MKKTEQQYIQELKEASEAYYNSDETQMSDEAFDNLRDEFLKLYPKSDYLKEVGSKVKSTLKMVKHRIPMGSLLKINTPDELQFWHQKYGAGEPVLWSEKLDGLSISLFFKDGKFTQAITRGDGIEGEDVSENVRKMKFLKKLKSSYTGDVRAEIVLSKENYKKYFSEKANPRNAAAGTVRRLDGDRCEHLELFCYYLEGEFETELEKFEAIEKLGLKTPKYGVCKTEKEIQSLWEKYEKTLRQSGAYDIDGICLFTNSIAAQQELGIVDGRPRYARAYKFSSESAVSKVEDVVWQVGRTGQVTGVAKITPVNLAGAVISSVSLHNLAEIKRKNIQLGQVIVVERKGDVIPQITKTIGEGSELNIPTKCPSCQSKLVKEEIYLMCMNSNECTAQRVGNLLFWMEVLDIKGFGEKMVQKLYEQGLVKDPSDFYSLKESDLSTLERSGEKLAKKLLQELHSKKEVEPDLFIKGIGMEDIGSSVSKLILQKHKFNDIFSLSEEDLLKIHGIGEETARKFVSGVKSNSDKIKKLMKIITLKEKKEGKFSGKSFCFTEVRDKALEQKLKDMGGTISDSVNKSLSYLIVKSASGTSSKIEKAKKNNVPIIEIANIDSLFQE